MARVHNACDNLIEHLGADTLAINITEVEIDAFKSKRKKADAANGTINRELSILKRGFKLSKKLLSSIPDIELLEEATPRQGFVTPQEFARLHDALPADLRDPVSFLYHSCWRVSEMRSLLWRDIKDGRITLRAENSKNKHPRSLPLRGEIGEIIQRAAARRRLDVPNVFHRNGRPIQRIHTYAGAWATATRKVGLPGLLIHDLRRSGIKNLIDAGIDMKTAMAVSGHKTVGTFMRYHIIDDHDVAKALDRLTQHLADQPVAAPTNLIQLKTATTGRQN
ncbi:MAG: site-specific integrase [Candidatus Binataceae bacterium]